MLPSFPCHCCKVSVLLEPFAIFHFMSKLMIFISKCSFSRNCSPSHAVWPLWPVYLSRMAYLMLRSFPCRYFELSVPLEPFAIFHLFDQFGDGCSGLLSDALWCFGLLWAALSCSGLLQVALSCSGLLWAALGCSCCSGALWAALCRSRLLWTALGCSGLLWAPHVSARLLHLVITVMTRCNISAWVVGGVFIFLSLCDYFQDWLTSANIECF